MVLESTVVCFDNSEFTRNADFSPNRLLAQQDATNFVCMQKTGDNPESSVGMITMAGNRPDVVVPPTQEYGKIIEALQTLECGGFCDLQRTLQTAQLVLKHRVNKSSRQRVILFVASPIPLSIADLELLGKRLKKNLVALDIISFGDTEENHEKVQALHNAVNSSGNSFLLEVPKGDNRLATVVMQSPIGGERAAALGLTSGSSAQGPTDFSNIPVDAAQDPDLYMAYRLSLEEEQGRQQREASSKVAEETRSLAERIAEIEAMEEDPEMKRVLIMSLQEEEESVTQVEQPKEQATEDKTELEALIAELPGVDPANASLKEALRFADRRDKADTDQKKKEEKKEEPKEGGADS